MGSTINRKKLVIAAAVAAAIAVGWYATSRTLASTAPSADGSGVFTAPPRTTDLSGAIHENLAAAKIPPGGEISQGTLAASTRGNGPNPQVLTAQTALAVKQAQQDAQKALQLNGTGIQAAQQAVRDDPVIAHLSRYGTPVTKQALPVGGLTMWTVISKSGKPVRLYTTADGKALFSGVVWNLESGRNVSESVALLPTGDEPNFSARLPQVVASATPKSNLVSGPNALPSAFDGKVPTKIPEAIRLVDELAGYKEGKGGPAETLYVIIDPRCPYCRRAYLNTREYVKNGVTIKWIPTAALGRPEQGLPLAATILRARDPDVVSRVLGNHEQISTPPTDFEMKQLGNSLGFMFEAFKQNNEPNPGVPVAFFIDRRTGNARMMMGVSEHVVIEDILGKPKK